MSGETIEVNLQVEPVVSDERLIKNLETIILHLKEGNAYTDEDKELLLYRTEEFVTGERKELDPDTMKYLFTGWFIRKYCLAEVSDLRINDAYL